MNKSCIIILLVIFFSNCEKQKIIKQPESISKIIYGKWEWRESIDLISFNDLDYHILERDQYLVFKFLKDETYILVSDQGNTKEDTLEQASFIVNEIDSTLILGGSSYEIFGYSQDTLDIRTTGRHGLFGRKLFKLE